MRKLATSLFAAAAIFLLSTAASASPRSAFGYVCIVNQYNAPGFGAHGGIYISFYTQPYCGGSYQFTGYACTESSASDVCTTLSFYAYSEPQLMGLFGELVAAGRAGTRVNYTWDSGAACRKNGSSCLQSVDFYSSY